MAVKNPQGLVDVGEGFERAGDLRGARQLYGQAMAVTPNSTEARVAYARVSSALGKDDEAVAILTALLREKPNDRLAQFTLSQVYADAGRFQGAADLLEKIEPERAGEFVLQGKVAHILGQPNQAKAAFTRALKLAPQDGVVLQQSALSYALAGDYAGAVEVLGQALDRPTTAREAQRSLAFVYALSGQRKAAIALAQVVMSTDEVQKLDLLYRMLPQFTAAEKATTLFFNRLPTDAIERLSGNATN
jgi:tetratricopeptide (TPR) repeat protein